MLIDLQTAAAWVGGKAADGFEKTEFSAVSTDTRKLTPGALYVSLRGPNFNGDSFIDAAFANGAAAVMLTDGSLLKDRPGIVVQDTLFSLGALAHQYRWQRNLIPWAAVTGSNGKTTTRSLLAHILRSSGTVCEPEANFNNLIGLPLTILRNEDGVKFGVLEMGTNAPGEIKRLTEIATPTVAILTNICPAHLLGLGSVEGVAKEKADAFSRLPADGLAVYPSQCEFGDLIRSRIPYGVRQATFAIEAHADLVAYDLKLEANGCHFSADGQKFFLPLLGRHNINNCLAALLAARHFGISLAAAAAALEQFTAVNSRLQVLAFPHFTIIDDAYNANPESMRAAARVLLDYPANRRVMVIGDMAELGGQSAVLHSEMGKWLSKIGIDVILAVGKEMLALAESAHAQNARQIIRYFPSVQSLLGHLKTIIESGDVILIKGSHSMNLERVVAAVRMLDKS